MSSQRHIAIIADQVGSRRSPDAVPHALTELVSVPAVLSFERTAGDEIQGLVPDGAAAVEAILRLWRLGEWSIGIGIGEVEAPLPASTREARGPAYLAARRSIEEAEGVAARLRIDAADSAARDAETVLRLAEPLVHGRSAATWQALELAHAGLTQQQIGEQLGITQGAVSRRLARAYDAEIQRASELSARLIDTARTGGS